MFGLPETTIQSVINIFKTYAKVEKVILFGSRALGNYKPGSDIDLAIIGNNITFDDILNLHIQIETLELPYQVDLVNFQTVEDENVLNHIKRAGTVFYEK